MLHRYLDSSVVTQELLDATSAFVGGTVFAGVTCSALTAGVMLIGFELGEIEDSLPRVLRLIGTRQSAAMRSRRTSTPSTAP